MLTFAMLKDDNTQYMHIHTCVKSPCMKDKSLITESDFVVIELLSPPVLLMGHCGFIGSCNSDAENSDKTLKKKQNPKACLHEGRASFLILHH